jgi:hypothetical protein
VGDVPERLVHLGGIVTKIKCGVIQNNVVASGEPNGTDVTRLGQAIYVREIRNADLNEIPAECPMLQNNLGERTLPDFSVCLGCDWSAVDRYATYSSIS